MSRYLEKKIVNKIIDKALAAGYSVDLFDGEEDVLTRCTDKDTILKEMFATDQDTLTFFKGDERLGFIFLVYGNDGWDVVNDYSVGLDDFMAPINTLADEMSE